MLEDAAEAYAFESVKCPFCVAAAREIWYLINKRNLALSAQDPCDYCLFGKEDDCAETGKALFSILNFYIP